MMIEFEDTVVADITVTRARRSKYETSLTKFELKDHRRVGLINLAVLHASSF